MAASWPGGSDVLLKIKRTLQGLVPVQAEVLGTFQDVHSSKISTRGTHQASRHPPSPSQPPLLTHNAPVTSMTPLSEAEEGYYQSFRRS